MNHIYKVIFNKATGTFVAVAEYAKGQGKQSNKGPSSPSSRSQNISNNNQIKLNALTLAIVTSLGLGMNANAASYAAGSGASATGGNATAIGNNAKATNVETVAIGSNVDANGSQSVAIGNDINAIGDFSVVIGTQFNGNKAGHKSEGQYSVAIGSGNNTARYAADADADLSVALGSGSRTDNAATSSVAIGDKALTKVEDSVALGAGSVTDREVSDALSIGYDAATGAASTDTSTTWKANSAAVSIGNGTDLTRQITSVAAGSQDTDAVNVAQLKASETHFYSVNNNDASINNYNNDGATGVNALAAGVNASAVGDSATALGFATKANGELSTAIGDSAQANGQMGLSVGRKAGQAASAERYNTFVGALNTGAQSQGEVNTYVGTNAGFKATGDNNNYLGSYAGNNADGSENTYVGMYAGAKTGQNIGSDTVSSQNTVMGHQAGLNINGNNNIITGYQSGVDLEGERNIVIGNQAGVRNTAIEDTVGIGTRSQASANNATALGTSTQATVENSVALGSQSVADRVALTGPTTSDSTITDLSTNNVYAFSADTAVTDTVKGTLSAVSVGNADSTRQITNVAAGSLDTDAVNVSQLRNIATNLDKDTYFHVNDGTNAGTGNAATNLGKVDEAAGATGENSLSAGINARARGAKSVAVGNNSGAFGTESVTIGNNARTHGNSVQGNKGVAIGSNAYVGDKVGVAIGGDAKAYGYAAAIGANSSATTGGSALGHRSNAGVRGVSVGQVSKSTTDAVAVGYESSASGARGIAIGRRAGAASSNSISVGAFSRTTSDFGVALGNNSIANRAALSGASTSEAPILKSNQVYSLDEASQTDKEAIGNTVKGSYGAVSVGNATNTRQIANVAAGSEDSDAVNVSQLKAVANASDETYFHVNTGSNTGGDANTNLGSIEQAAGATAKGAITAGVNASATGESSVAIGESATATNGGSLAFGESSQSTGANSIAMGEAAQSLGNNTIAIGADSNADTTYATALGRATSATGSGSTAIGGGTNDGAATANGSGATAIGGGYNSNPGANASGTRSLALGNASSATLDDSIALGSQSITSVDAGVTGANPLGAPVADLTNSTWTSTRAAVSVGDVSNNITRQITSVAAGTEATDAVNVAQLESVAEGADRQTYFHVNDGTNAGTGDAITNLGGIEEAAGATANGALAAGRDASAGYINSTAVGTQAKATGEDSVSVGYLAGSGANSSGNNTAYVGYKAGENAAGTYNVAVGADAGAEVTGDNNAALGVDAGRNITGDNNVSFGRNTNVNAVGSSNVSIGNLAGSNLEGDSNISIGNNTNNGVKGLTNGIAIGNGAKSEKNVGIALGNLAKSQAVFATAIGHNSTASGSSSVAIGPLAKSTQTGSVALGQSSVADTAAGVTGVNPLGAPVADLTNSTWRSTRAAVSVGDISKNITRQITSVAAGTEATDAVNVAQLESVAEGADRQTYFHVRNADQSNTGTGDATNNLGSIDDAAGATGLTSVAAGERAVASGDRGVAVGFATAALGQDTTAIGYRATAQDGQGVAIGYRTEANGIASTSLGSQSGRGSTGNVQTNVGALAGAYANGYSNTSVGVQAGSGTDNNNNTGHDNVSIGYQTGSTVTGSWNTAVGSQAGRKVTGAQNTAVGRWSGQNVTGADNSTLGVRSGQNITGKDNVALGAGAGNSIVGSTNIAIGESAGNNIGSTDASVSSTISIGERAQANNESSIAIGTSAIASTDNSVALGANSVANRDVPTVSGYDMATETNSTIETPVWRATRAAVSVGDVDGETSITRQITSVAAGSEDTDAVNVAQLKTARTEVEAGTNVTDVVSEVGDDGQTIYTVNADGATASAGSNAVTVTKGTKDANNVTDYAVDLSQDSKDSLAKADSALQTVVTQIDGSDVKTLTKDANTANFVTGDNMVLSDDGNGGIEVATAKDVTFDSVTADKVTVGPVTINKDTGINAGDTVITGVAPGTISDTSTDAINGSQLNTVQDLANRELTFTGNTNADTDNNGTQQQLGSTLNIIGSTTAIGGLSEDTSAETAGTEYSATNLQTVVTDGQVQVQMSDNPIFKDVTADSVTTGNTTLNNDGIKIANGANPVTLTNTGLDNGNNTITNVANGVDDSDAVNVAQLKTARTEVEAGTNITDVVSEVGDNGQTIYTVNADGTSVSANETSALTVVKGDKDADSNVTDYAIDLNADTKADIADGKKHNTVVAGNNVSITEGTNTAEGVEYTVNAEKSIVSSDSLSVTQNPNADTNTTDYKVELEETDQTTLANAATGFYVDADVKATADNAADNVKLTETVTYTADDSNVVTTVRDNEIGFKLADDVTIANSLTVGPVSIKDTGINAGNTKITGVAPGTISDTSTDAINGSQLNTVQDLANRELTFTGNTNADTDNNGTQQQLGSTLSIIGSTTAIGGLSEDTSAETAGTEYSATNLQTVVTDGQVQVQMSDNPIFKDVTADSVTTGNTTLNNDGITIANGPSLTNTGLDNAGQTITNVAPGTADTDAVNVSQLKDTNTNVAKGFNVGDGNTDNNYALGDTVNFTEADGNVLTTTTATGVEFGLANVVNVGKAKPVTINGDAGTVNGLTNTTYDPANIVTGQAATEDQLQQAAAASQEEVTSEDGSITVATTQNTDGADVFDLAVNTDGTTITKDADGNIMANTSPLTNDTNGSVNTPAAPNALATSGDIANAINNSGFNVIAAGNETGAQTTLVKPSETVTYAAGDNLTVAQDGTTFTYATAKDVVFDSMTAGPVVINSTGINAGNTKITNVAPGTDATDAVNVSQLNDTNTNVAKGFNIAADNGTDDNVQLGDTVTYTSTDDNIVTTVTDNQIDFGLSNVVTVGTANPVTINGDKGTVNGLTNTTYDPANIVTGQAATEDQLQQAAAASQEVVTSDDGSIEVTESVDATTKAKTFDVSVNTDGTTITKDADGNIMANTSPITTDSSGLVNTPAAPNALATSGDIANAINNSGFTVKANGDAGELINPSDEVEFLDGKNIAITRDGGQFTVATKADVDFDNVTVGPVTINKDTGIDAGDTVITNVKAGVADTDAVNVSQLKTQVAAATTEVEAGTNIADVTKSTGANGQTIYTVNAKGTTLSSESLDITPTVDAATNTTDYKVELTADDKASLDKADSALQTVVTQIDGGNVKTIDKDNNAANFVTGKNIKLEDDGKGGIKVSTADNVTFTNVTSENVAADNMTVENVGDTPNSVTNKQYVDDGRTQVKSSNGTVSVTKTSSGNANVYDLSVDSQGVMNNSQLPVVYTDAEGNKVYKQADGTFNTAINGSGDMVNTGEIITSINSADGSTTTPTKLSNVADGEISATSKDAVNGSQLFATNEKVEKNAGDIATNTGNIANNTTNIAGNTASINKGLNLGDGVTANNYQLGDTVEVTGDSNITTSTTAQGVEVGLAKDITVDSVTAGNTTVNNEGVVVKAPANNAGRTDVALTAQGLNNGGNTITNLAPGIKPTDAVNVSQLSDLGYKLSNKIDDVEDDANAGVSSAMAMAALPQAYLPGKSMLTGGMASYNGEAAVAVGLSKLSDNGRWVFKISGSADTEGNAGGAVGAGFHF